MNRDYETASDKVLYNTGFTVNFIGESTVELPALSSILHDNYKSRNKVPENLTAIL